MEEYLINSPVLQTLAITLIHFMWQGLLVAAVVKLLLSIISPMRPLLRYSVTAVAMVASLLLPIFTFFYFYQPVANLGANHFSIIPIESFQHVLQQTGSLVWYQQGIDYLPYLSVAWISWVIFLTLRLLTDVIQVQRLPYSDTIDAEPQMLIRFEQLATQIGLSKVPQLVISLKAEVPMAIGWLKPVVLMPAKMIMGLNQEQLEMLLLHELAHIRRHDYLVNFLQTLVEILLFFHPAVLWVSKQMRQEREYCSDDIAVSHCGSAVAYAHTLADTAELCSKHRHATIPTMAMAASGGDLKERVYRIVNHSCTSDNDSGRWLAGLTIAITLFAIASKQLITLPLLELTSGLNVFNTTPNTQAQASPSEDLAEFSIAQQLLTPEQNIRANTVPLIANLDGQERTTEENKTVETVEQKRESKTSDAKLTRETSLTQNTQQEVKQTEQNAKAKKIISQPVEVEADIEQTFTNALAVAGTEQAVPDKENPYKNEISSLSNDELATDSKIEQLLAEPSPSQAPLANILETPETNSALSTEKESVGLFEQKYKVAKPALFEQPVTQDAKSVKLVDPKYPSVAKRKGIELEVLVHFVIDTDGRVTDIQFQRQSKLSYFKSSIIAAIKKWRFEPAIENGKPVQSEMSKIFSFNLN